MRRVKNVIGMAFLPMLTFVIFFLITRLTDNTSLCPVCC